MPLRTRDSMFLVTPSQIAVSNTPLAYAVSFQWMQPHPAKFEPVTTMNVAHQCSDRCGRESGTEDSETVIPAIAGMTVSCRSD